MELWVRDQTKTGLYKIDNVYIHEDEDKTIHILTDGIYLGSYKTKERALKIIDEIQNILIIKNSFSLNDEIITKSFEKNTEEEIGEVIKQMSVYQMPEE